MTIKSPFVSTAATHRPQSGTPCLTWTRLSTACSDAGRCWVFSSTVTRWRTRPLYGFDSRYPAHRKRWAAIGDHAESKANPMSITKNTLGKTHVSRSYPWGLHPRNGHRLLCSDGVIRAAEMAETADTYFSIPASVRINGNRVSGYATCERDSKWQHEVWAFRHHTNQGAPLPKWPSWNEPEHDALISKAAV